MFGDINDMKILLCAVNAKYIHSNLAVYSIRANAGEYRDQIELGEYTINQYVEDILQDIYQKKPDLIAFSCYIWNIRHIRELVRELRKVMPKVPIWLGGPEASYDAKGLLKNYPEVTGVLVGEGEESFYELCKFYDGKITSLSNVKGIAYREEGDIIVKPFELVKDFSSLKFAYEDFHDLLCQRYFRDKHYGRFAKGNCLFYGFHVNLRFSTRSYSVKQEVDLVARIKCP